MKSNAIINQVEGFHSIAVYTMQQIIHYCSGHDEVG